MLAPVRLRRGERAFVLWAGLKGAVPILLGTYVVAEGVPGADRIYAVIFVVVLVSVVVQGGLVPTLARLVAGADARGRAGAVGARACGSATSPRGSTATSSSRGRAADGSTIARPPTRRGRVGQHRQPAGRMVRVNGATVLEPGDEVLAITADAALAEGLFRSG